MASAKPLSVLTVSGLGTTQTSANFSSNGYESGYFLLNVTANPGGVETLTLALQIKKPGQVSGSDVYRTITAFAASTAAVNQMHVFAISEGAAVTSATAGFFAQQVALPPEWRVIVTHSAGGNWTYTVDAWLYNKSR